MSRSRKRLSRPLYESLPWLYAAGGAAAVAVSYLIASRPWSLVLGLSGIVAVIAGLAVWLRRRDFRELRANYADPEGLSRDKDDD
jgi:membrane associated rhomboid family serine protease